mgnify:CR=1 FL=1
MNLEGLHSRMITRKGLSFSAKKETYRGKTIEIYPVSNNDFISCYNGKGFLAVSYQKNLIEKVIDAEKDEKSLRQDVGFTSIAHTKTANFLTFIRTYSVDTFAGRRKY